jgi:LPS-assembly lipoprotein
MSHPLQASRRRWLCAAPAAAFGAVLLSGCGFKLRQPAKLSFASIALTGFVRRSALGDELRRQLAMQVQVLDSPDKADVVLEVLDDSREKSVVASTAAAQVRELQLRLKFNFRARAPGGRELIPRVELLAKRDLSYSETAALAKEAEESELFREMQTDVVAQVLRRLAAVAV